MAIKYDRKRHAEAPRPRHAILGRPPGQLRVTQRNRFVIIYGGIAAFLVLALAIGGARDRIFASTTRRGIGTITSKRVDHLQSADAVYVVNLEIELPPGQTVVEEFATEPEPWKKLRDGQRVNVVYRVDRQGNYRELAHVGVFEDSPPLSP